MRLNTFLVICLFLISFDVSYGQVTCVYKSNSTYGYTCELTVKNPTGLNNFASIGGTHLSGKTNNDVWTVFRTLTSNTTNVPSIICDKFQGTSLLELSGIGIQTIDDKAFKNCKNLYLLYIHKNKITSIHENAFLGNAGLTAIYAYENQLTGLPENLFKNQYNLDYFIVSWNKILDLPKNIFNPLKKITRLDIAYNQIKTLRYEWFMLLTNLQYLYLQVNQIEEFPRNIFTPLKKLNTIGLYNNKLKIIHSNAFRGLTNLKSVSIYNNQIEAVDEGFIDTGVQELDFRNNVCASQSIFDDSPAKMTIRLALSKCFENYDNSLLGRISKLETANAELQSQNRQLTTTTNEMQIKVNNITAENNKIRLENQRLTAVTEGLEGQNRALRLDVDTNARKIEENQKTCTNKTASLEAKIVVLINENRNQSTTITDQGLAIVRIQAENKSLRQETDELQDQVEDLLKENEDQNILIENQGLTIESQGSQITEQGAIITDLQEETQHQQEILDIQAKKLDDLQYQIYELSNRPCACK